LYLGGLRIFLLFGFGLFCRDVLFKKSALIEKKWFFTAEAGQFVLGCFFGLGFDLFAG
jgi:hypothetical protein